MRYIGLLSAPPEPLDEITHGALERQRELDWTATDLRPVAVTAMLYGAIRSARPSIDDEQLRAVMPTDRDDKQEVGA